MGLGLSDGVLKLGVGGGALDGGGVAGLEHLNELVVLIFGNAPGKASSAGLDGLLGATLALPPDCSARKPGPGMIGGTTAPVFSSLTSCTLLTSLPFAPSSGTDSGGGTITLLPLLGVGGTLIKLDASLPDLNLLFPFLENNFHCSASPTLISSTSFLVVENGLRLDSDFGLPPPDSMRCRSALPALLLRFACSSARLASICARERALTGGGANMVVGRCLPRFVKQGVMQQCVQL